MKILSRLAHMAALLLLMLVPAFVSAQDIDRFVGSYSGQSAEVLEGETRSRDLQTTIEASRAGFNVTWTSTTYKAGDEPKSKTYEIEFVPSQRDNIYGSAMKTNMFGKQVPLDPLQGEPFVWSRFEGDTFSLFSLFINEVGEYELQEFHRTLEADGLNLLFRRVSNGVPQKEITAFLARQ